MRSNSIILILFLTVASYLAQSQNISKYLNDGGASNSKLNLKIGFDPINGALPLIFEYGFSKKFSLELSAAPVSVKRQNWLYTEDPMPIGESGYGLAFSGTIKVFKHTFPERMYFGLQSGVSFFEEKTIYDFACVKIGYQRAIVRKWMLGFEAGFGFRYYKDNFIIAETVYPDNGTRFMVPVVIHTGFML